MCGTIFANREISFAARPSGEDVAQEQLVLEVYLVIEIRPQPVLMRLPVLRHHDDRRLQRGEHVQSRAEQQIWIRIESAGYQDPAIYYDPDHSNVMNVEDKFPAPAEFRDSSAARSATVSRAASS